MHFFELPRVNPNKGGLLAINHEYIDEGLLFPDGFEPMTATKVKKAQNAHGISVIEVKLGSKGWEMVRPSRYARRITANTPFAVGGPAAGHALMRTAADPEGKRVLGTLNNCASSMTPWGTYLSGEENWAFYFQATGTGTGLSSKEVTSRKRYGVATAAPAAGERRPAGRPAHHRVAKSSSSWPHAGTWHSGSGRWRP